MATTATKIGRVSINPQGEYSSGTQYQRLDVVTYQGSGYICIQDCQNKPVTNTAYWYLLVSKGDTYEVTEEDLQRIALQIEEDASSLFNQLVAQKTSEFNTNATQKTNDFNSNATSKTSDFNSNATSKTSDFNTNATAKTTGFNQNATEKTTGFDANYNDKVGLFNGNATTKTTDFNTNATEKTSAFDEHVGEQTEDFDEHVEEYSTRLTSVEDLAEDNEERIALLEDNFEPKAIETPSDNVKVTDSASGRVKDFTTIGKTKQNQYTGKNKMNYMNNIKARNTGGTWNENVYTYNGVTYTIQEDEKIIVNGTATGASYLKLVSTLDLVASESYILTGCPAGGATSKYSMRLYTGSNYSSETGNGLSFNFDSQDVVRINVSDGTTVNNLKFEPMIRLASVEDATYEPYVGGIASPNPDYTQPINNVTGNIIVNSSNKNLVDATDELNYGIYANDIQPALGRIAYLVKVKPSTTYSFSRSAIGTATYCHVATLESFTPNQNNNFIHDYTVNTALSYSFTTEPNAKYVMILTGQGVSPDVQLEESSTSTTYVSHKGKQVTFPLATGQKMYEGDYLANDGIHHVRKQVDMGSLPYSYSSNNGYFSVSLSKMKNTYVAGDMFEGKATCYTATTIPVSASQWASKPNWVMAAQTNGTGFRLKDTRFTDPADLRTALTGQILEYPLAQEEIEPYTEAQQTAWNELQKLETYKNTTIVYTSSDGVSPDSDFTYLVDPTVLINSRLDDLEQAVVAQNSNN